MRRSDLEHLIRASGKIADDDEIIVIGSQAILGQFPDAPLRLLMSMEADVFPANKPEMADRIDGAIGEGSSFHELHGYYAQAVGAETAVLPRGWRSRLISVRNQNTNGVTGLCLEVHDLSISKIIAYRPKDIEFIRDIVRYELIDRETMLERLGETKLDDHDRSAMENRINSFFRA